MKKILSYFTIPLLFLLSNSSGDSAPQPSGPGSDGQNVIQQRLAVGNGEVTLELDVNRLAGVGAASAEPKLESFRFDIGPSSFFTIRAFNDALRGPEPGSIALTWPNAGDLPAVLVSSANQLLVQKTASGEPFDLVVRDGWTGFVFFNIQGDLYEYDATAQRLTIEGGKLLLSEALAKNLGRPTDSGSVVGKISIATSVYPIETTTFVNGAASSSVLPARGKGDSNAPAAVPGPDIIVGDIGEFGGVAQFGSSGTQVGLGAGTTSCNNGDQPVHFYQLPNPDHSVVSQNFYRMSGGPNNNDRFEQLGFSWVKHTFGADQDNACNLGCIPFANATELGVGCSDPYTASQNAFQNNTNSGALGSRAWVNPFTGAFPVSPRPENHTGHTHIGTSHRVVVEASDLNPALNPGATYYMEVQYDTPQEYAWCQSHPGQCNMYNNASYRRYNVSGTSSFTFSPVGATVRMTPATGAWTGSTSATIEPAPGEDGRAFVVYKVSTPSAGVWHYEYLVHNQNLDRAIQSFSVPLGCGITLSNIGFRAPPNHPGFPNDGTVGNTGFSSTPWTTTQTPTSMSWNSETFAQNPNANAIRFGTTYNFRFDSNRPPQAANATIGFLKTGTPITVAIQGPAPVPGPCNPLVVNSAVSRKTHTNGARTIPEVAAFDVPLPLSGTPGVECRSGGAGGDHMIVVTFPNNVVSGNASVTSGVGSVAGNPSFNNNTMTVNLTGVGNAQTIAVTLSNVTDEFSQVLADTPLNASFLLGDTNGDRAVNAGDALQTRNRAGQAADGTNFRSDVNLDGFVNSGDTFVVRGRSGDSVP